MLTLGNQSHEACKAAQGDRRRSSIGIFLLSASDNMSLWRQSLGTRLVRAASMFGKQLIIFIFLDWKFYYYILYSQNRIYFKHSYFKCKREIIFKSVTTR